MGLGKGASLGSLDLLRSGGDGHVVALEGEHNIVVVRPIYDMAVCSQVEPLSKVRQLVGAMNL
jgi:hypothetical protein